MNQIDQINEMNQMNAQNGPNDSSDLHVSDQMVLRVFRDSPRAGSECPERSGRILSSLD